MPNSKRKGKEGELELAAELRRLFGVAARRGQQFSGIEGKDVVGLPGVHVECKRVEKLNINRAVDQAFRDAQEAGDVPIVCHRTSRRPWLVTVRLDDLSALVERIQALSECQST